VVGGGFGGEAAHAEAPARIYFSEPISAEAAATWRKLQMKVAMPFANETPLEDVLKYIQAATSEDGPGKGEADKNAAKGEPKFGLQIYVDPVGLQEAEKTMTSPITMNLDGVPLSTTLGLVLKQLGLTYSVQKDGILVIDSEDSARRGIADATTLMLDQLAALRKEVGELKLELVGLRTRADRPAAGQSNSGQPHAPQQGMMGGMGGLR
jgi:hypothetical protein